MIITNNKKNTRILLNEKDKKFLDKAKALRENLKKRKIQTNTRKNTKEKTTSDTRR